MKTTRISLVFVALALVLPDAACAQDGSKPNAPRYRDAATHDRLTKASSNVVDPMKTLEQASLAEDPAKKNVPVNLLEQSDIISFRGLATLIPKRAIMIMPEKYKSRCQFEKGSKIVSWADFIAQNRGWITAHEVSLDQAAGDQEIDEETQLRLKKGSNLVVATYQGGAISVLPLKVKPTQE